MLLSWHLDRAQSQEPNDKGGGEGTGQSRLPWMGPLDLLVQSSNVLTIHIQEQPVSPEGLMDACVGLFLLGGACDQIPDASSKETLT